MIPACKHTLATRVSALLVLAFALAQASAGPPTAATPYGHRVFYPSAERPLGFLADGNGRYPGAELPKMVDVDKGVGVAWERLLPNGMAQPLVIGEKLIVTADPWLVVCLSVHDGAEQWRVDLAPDRDMPAPLAEGYRSEVAYYERCQEAYAEWRQLALELASVRARHKLHHREYPLLVDRKPRKGEPAAVKLPIDDKGFQEKLTRLRAEQLANGFQFHQPALFTTRVSFAHAQTRSVA